MSDTATTEQAEPFGVPESTTGWALPTDDEILDEFRDMGISLFHPSTDATGGRATAKSALEFDQAERDAIAGSLLRRMGELADELEELSDSFEKEKARLLARHARRCAPIQRQYDYFESQVRHLAMVSEETGGFGKKKSRDVLHGTYGSVAEGERIDVRDATALLEWAEQRAPDLVRVRADVMLPTARQLFTEKELQDFKRDIPAKGLREYLANVNGDPVGVVRIPASRRYFAKPEP